MRPEAPTYGEMYSLAVKQQKALVVFVGTPIAPSVEWLSIRVEKLQGFTAPCVVVSRPRGNELMWLATLDCHVSHDGIRGAVLGSVVKSVASYDGGGYTGSGGRSGGLDGKGGHLAMLHPQVFV